MTLIVEQILKYCNETPVIVYILLILFGFNWFYGIKRNHDSLKSIRNFNESEGIQKGIVYRVEFGWRGFRLIPIFCTAKQPSKIDKRETQ